jgi:very-short-patch-repair endonuclease
VISASKKKKYQERPNIILYMFILFDLFKMIPHNLDIITNSKGKWCVDFVMLDEKSTCFEIIVKFRLEDSVTFSSSVYILEQGQFIREKNKYIHSKNSLIIPKNMSELKITYFCNNNWSRKLQNFIFNDIVEKISAYDFNDNMKKYSQFLSLYLFQKKRWWYIDSMKFVSKMCENNDLIRIFDGYEKMWGSIYFSFFDTNEITYFNIFIKLDNFIEKYFLMDRHICSECDKKIMIHLFGKCFKCVVDNFSTYRETINKEYDMIKSLVNNATYDGRFIKILNSILEKMYMSNTQCTTNLNMYMRASIFRIHMNIIKDIFEIYCYNHEIKCPFVRKHHTCVSVSYCTWNDIFSLMIDESCYFKEKNAVVTREVRISIDKKRYDFACMIGNKKFLIEIDDASHSRPSAIDNDLEKDYIAYQLGVPLLRLDIEGFPLLRVNYLNAMYNFDKLCEAINEFLREE